MKIFHGFKEVHSIKNAVVTTGSFDGVHAGHKVILDRLKKLARETGGETVVITFDPHPRKVLNPETAGDDLWLIHSLPEKIKFLQASGLDNLIISRFTLEFSQVSPAEFVKNYLAGKLQAKKIVIGFNHHFGHNREGDTDKLRQMGTIYGFDVEEIPEQDIRNERVSSTKIRNALLEGDIQKANAYLGAPYIIMGRVEKNDPSFNESGFPGFCIKIEEERKLIPPDGAYAIMVKDHLGNFKGMCCVRKNGKSSVDARVDCYFPDNPGVLRCKNVTVHFFHRIRVGIDFSTPDDLRRQLQADRLVIEQLDYGKIR